MNGRQAKLALTASIAAVAILAAGAFIHFARAPRADQRRAFRALSRRTLAIWLDPRPLAEPSAFLSDAPQSIAAAIARSTEWSSPLRIAFSPPDEPAGALHRDIPLSPGLRLTLGAARDALANYEQGQLAQGDALAAEVADPIARLALEWAALRGPAEVGFDRLNAFLVSHPNWPAAGWVRQRAEAAIWREQRGPRFVERFFTKEPPQTIDGKLALARALLTQGHKARASAIIRRVWRDDDPYPWLENYIHDTFGSMLTSADDSYRASRLLYEGQTAASLRAAADAGKGELALIDARIGIGRGQPPAKLLALTPKDLRADPGILFAKVVRLMRLGKDVAAAKAVLTAPADPTALVDGDAWWLARRNLARRLLAAHEPTLAYRLCADAPAQSRARKLEADFMAGWIALRFLHRAALAAPHFAALAALATTPVSKARAAYWQGRAAEALRAPTAAGFFRAAAVYPTTYYGQLAAAKLGRPPAPLVGPRAIAVGAARDPAIQVVELLGDLGDRRDSLELALATARKLNSVSQLAALAQVGVALKDARETLLVGKIADSRGFPLEKAAFPTFGVPAYRPLAHSAPPDVVYAVARQESAFRATAVSSAGAQGLMQMILSTARSTAKRFRLPFAPNRLTSDPAFNAELGAAHLGQLLREQRGSLILTFAAYNAGERRVREWIRAFGDPRRPGVNPIDWVEQIPIAETRNYIERVMENFNVYKRLFARQRPGSVTLFSDLPTKRGGEAAQPTTAPASDPVPATPQAKL